MGAASTTVTARDNTTGETESQTITDDYVIVTDGECEIVHVAVYANGTHMISVKGVKRG